MMSRPLALALGALLALAPAVALATERGCPGPSLDADASFRARFPDLLDQLQRQLAARADLDPCARVELHSEGDTVITLVVTLPDGRAASRSVTRRDDVIPTLQALLLVPAQPVVASTAASTAAPSPAASVAPARPRAEPRRLRLQLRASPSPLDRDAPALIHTARTVGVELSVLTGVRMGDGQIGLGAGALGFLEVHGWLLGFEGRADSYRPLLNGDPETALELALLAGRRFDFGGVALDLSAGPAVAMKGLAFSQSQSAQVVTSGSGEAPPPPTQAPPPTGSDPGSGPVPRLLLGARFGFSPRSIFRTFVGVDGAVGPRRVDNDADSASARLPAFSLGLALGATVGTP